jgi:hypothetical protein
VGTQSLSSAAPASMLDNSPNMPRRYNGFEYEATRAPLLMYAQY